MPEKKVEPPPATVDELKGLARIKNQKIGHFLIVPTFFCSMIFFTCLFIVLLVFSIALMASAGGNKDFEYRYDDICQPKVDNKTSWTFTFTLDSDLDSPYFYYQMNNFYVNHRKYVKSRSYDQLRGSSASKSSVDKFCTPIIENIDIPVNVSFTGMKLNDTDLAYPCGLIGKYRFTDRFELRDANNTVISIDSGDIANSVDVNDKFKNFNNPGSKQWLDFEDQHLMVWYQMESFPFFRKFYGKIKPASGSTLAKGKYTMTVKDQWDTKQFKGEKYLYFSTINGLGGTNMFLGVVFIVVAILVLAVMATILIFECVKGSKPSHYSLDNLAW